MSYTFIAGVIFALLANINKLIDIIYNIIVKKQAKKPSLMPVDFSMISEPEIPIAVIYSRKVFTCLVAYAFVRDILKQAFYHSLAFCTGSRRGIVPYILLQCHECIRQTTIGYLSVLEKSHETVAGTPLTITGRAKTRYMVKVEQPFHHLIERTVVGNIELCRVLFFGFRTDISSYTCT